MTKHHQRQCLCSRFLLIRVPLRRNKAQRAALSSASSAIGLQAGNGRAATGKGGLARGIGWGGCWCGWIALGRSPNSKTHLVMARRAIVDTDMRVASFWKRVNACDLHFLAAPALRQFSAAGHQQTLKRKHRLPLSCFAAMHSLASCSGANS